MQHPKITIILGKDSIKVKQELKNLDINYNIIPYQILDGKTQVQIQGYAWFRQCKAVYLVDILEGLKLPFFKSELVELEWNVANCVPQYYFNNWDIDLVNDLKLWLSTDSNFKLTETDRELVTKTVNNCIHQENETLRLYTEALKPTFLHPQIQTLLNYCVRQKEAHINMWCNVKEKFKLEYQSPIFIKIRKPATILEFAIDNLKEVISREEILEPIIIECLICFIHKSQLTEFSKMIERRNKESKQNAKLVTILFKQVEKMYPFIE